MDWNISIALFMVVFVAFALVLGRAKAVLLMLSTYAALAIASEAGQLVSSVVNKVQENSSLFVVKTALFFVIMLFLVLKGEWGADNSIPDRGTTSTIMTLVYGLLTYGLVLTSLITFLPEQSQTDFLAASTLAAKAFQYHLWWLILPIFIMITASFFRHPTGK